MKKMTVAIKGLAGRLALGAFIGGIIGNAVGGGPFVQGFVLGIVLGILSGMVHIMLIGEKSEVVVSPPAPPSVTTVYKRKR